MHMENIKISDVNKRIRALSSIREKDESTSIECANLISECRISDIKRFIENSSESNNTIPFFIYMELYDKIIENGTVSDVESVGRTILEKALPKIRNSKETNSLLHRRMGRIKAKLKPKNRLRFDGFSFNKKKKKRIHENTLEGKYEAALDIVEEMYYDTLIMQDCDRVIENYNSISKVFNLDRLFENNYKDNGLYDTVLELCKLVDTYSTSNLIKFNTIIETAWYALESRNISYDKSEVLQAAADYFVFKEEDIHGYKETILETTLFYDKEDINKVDVFMEDEPEEEPAEKTPSDYIDLYVNEADTNTFSENDKKNFTKILKNFKEKEAKDNPQNKIKTLFNKLYSRDVNGVIEGTPKLLTWVRSFFILSTVAIPVVGPVLGGISFIADRIISLKMERKEIAQMIRCFKTEMKATKDKMNSTTDPDSKKNLDKYYNTLKKAEDKLESYYYDLFGDNEEEEMYGNIQVDDGGSDDLEFDFDDDFGFSLESASINLNRIETVINSFTEKDSIITESDMSFLMSNMGCNDINNVSLAILHYPDELLKESALRAIEGILNNIISVNYESVVDRALRKESLSIAKHIVKGSTVSALSEMNNDFSTIATECEYFYEIYSSISNMVNVYKEEKDTHRFMEASITNRLKNASDKLKQAMRTMTTNEKNISRNIDSTVDILGNNIEKAVTSGDREKIIKGSILPSASRIIKLGIANASLLAIGQPVLAVIATIGYFFLSKKFKNKERQMLIDDIEVELKMCQKQIEIASSKDDLKALNQLYKIQRELERQHSRLKYKMKTNTSTRYLDRMHDSNFNYKGLDY